MHLDLNTPILSAYKSFPQRARVITEGWAEKNLYCPACISNQITRLPNNTQAIDFSCPLCSATFQLKATRKKIQRKIVDAGYDAMIRSLLQDKFPHLFVMQYNSLLSSVENLLLIPKHLLSLSAIEKRKPLASTARRAGWVGCNIILDHIPPEGRINFVSSGAITDLDIVRAQFKSTLPLSKVPPIQRGWTLDVLTGLRSLSRSEFGLSEIYSSLEKTLSKLHPENHNIRPKIRQQLQILRDLNYLTFVQKGLYRIKQTQIVNVKK